MTHCGFEPSAVIDSFENPVKGIIKNISGIKTSGPVQEDISLIAARPAEDLYEQLLESKMYELDLHD